MVKFLDTITIFTYHLSEKERRMKLQHYRRCVEMEKVNRRVQQIEKDQRHVKLKSNKNYFSIPFYV